MSIMPSWLGPGALFVPEIVGKEVITPLTTGVMSPELPADSNATSQYQEYWDWDNMLGVLNEALVLGCIDGIVLYQAAAQ